MRPPRQDDGTQRWHARGFPERRRLVVLRDLGARVTPPSGLPVLDAAAAPAPPPNSAGRRVDGIDPG